MSTNQKQKQTTHASAYEHTNLFTERQNYTTHTKKRTLTYTQTYKQTNKQTHGIAGETINFLLKLLTINSTYAALYPEALINDVGVYHRTYTRAYTRMQLSIK